MQAAKEKAKDMVSAAKKKVKEHKVKAEEKAAATTREEKEIAHERAKVKEAEAKMELHREKAQHRQETATAHRGHLHPPAATIPNLPGTTAPAYPSVASGTTLPGGATKY